MSCGLKNNNRLKPAVTLAYPIEAIDADLIDGGGILDFKFDGAAPAVVAVDATVVRTFGNQNIAGHKFFKDITVTGTQYIEHSKDLYVGDPLITLNSGVAGSNTYDIGWIGDRGSDINVGVIWDEAQDQFAMVSTTDDGSTIGTISISDYEDFRAGNIIADDTVVVGTTSVQAGGFLQVVDKDLYGGPMSGRMGMFGGAASWDVGMWQELAVGYGGLRSVYYGSSKWGQHLTYGTYDDFVSSGQSTALAIDGDGNVGIGTTDPLNVLHVRGGNGNQLLLDNGGQNWTQLNLGSGGSPHVFVGLDGLNKRFVLGAQGPYAADGFEYIGFRPSGSTDAMVIEATHNVGIGTTAPGAKLHLHTPGVSTPLLLTSGNGETGVRVFMGSDGPVLGLNSRDIAGTDTIRLDARTSSSSDSWFNAGGKVGIGTTAPSVTLTVSGTDAISVPLGTAAQRPVASLGYIRYNLDSNNFEGYTGRWGTLGGGGTASFGDFAVTTTAPGTAALSYDGTAGLFTYTPPATGSIASKDIGDFVELGDLSVTVGSAGTANLTYNDTNGVFTYTPPNTGTIAHRNASDFVEATTLTDYVAKTDTGCAASKTCEYFTGKVFNYGLKAGETFSNGDMPKWDSTASAWTLVAASSLGIQLSDLSVTTAAAGTASLSYNSSNGVFTYTPPVTGSIASKDISDFVSSSSIGNYVAKSDTGCAASKTCEYFTGSLFGDEFKPGETFADGDTPVWQSSSSKWQLVSNAGGGTDPAGSDTEIQWNDGGTAFGASADFTWNDTTKNLVVDGIASIEHNIELGPGDVGFAFIDFKNDVNDDYSLRAGTDASNDQQFNFSSSGGIGDIYVQRNSKAGTSGIFGKAAIGTWGAAGGGTAGIVGHSELDHSAAGNYSLGFTPPGYTYINAAAGKAITFRTGNVNEYMLDVSGGIGVGLHAPPTLGMLRAANDVVAFYSSDRRLKDDITSLSNPIEKVSRLSGVDFEWNDKSYPHLSGRDVGVIAQGVQEVLPTAVEERPDGYLAVQYEKVVPLLIEAIKEQQKQIEALDKKVDFFTNRLS